MTDQPTPLTEQQLTEYEQLIAQTTPLGAATASPGMAAVLAAEVRRLKGQRKYLITQLAKRDAETGRGDRALREFLGGETTTEDLASADNPTQLRWGLDDVLWGDDDSVTVLLSDEERRPYWLELDQERAAVLRDNLAGPDGEQPADDETGTRPCGHDDYHDPHEWADRPGVWCPGHSHADDAPAVPAV